MDYTFEKLIKHSASITRDSSSILVKHWESWDDAIKTFSEFYEKLEKSPLSIARNVKMVLSTRFFNHVYSALILVEKGLLSDAVICERSAVESLAGYKMICAEPELAEKYNTGKFPKPVEIRIKLEKLGYSKEAENIRDIYKTASGITHLSRDHERFSINWETKNNGVLYIGGNSKDDDIEHMIEFLPALFHWFIMPTEKSANN